MSKVPGERNLSGCGRRVTRELPYGPTLGQVWAVSSQVRQMGRRAEAGGRKGCQDRGMEGEAGAMAPLSLPASYKGTKWRRERMWKTREVEEEPSPGLRA